MKAWVLEKPGIEHLRLVDRPEPQPGPGEVKLRIRAVSLNYRDPVAIAGGYGSTQRQAELVPGSDGAGEVVAVGAGVTRFKPGDRAVPHFFLDWPAGGASAEFLASNLGGRNDGTFREFACFPQASLVHTPEHLSDVEAATLSCAGVTAWSAIVAHGHVAPGQVVVTQGTGGVSLFALQFAKAAGAEVIITSSSDEKLARARALGADHGINYRAEPQWARRVHEITRGRGADLVVELGGQETLEQSLRAARIGGSLMTIGVLSGPRPALNLGLIVTRGVRLQGVTVGSKAEFEAMLRAMVRHRLKPVLDATEFAFADLKDAIAHLKAGRHFGKIPIRV
ncbi:MAG: NAD(P)-dependent alcohol dehydrogenase [Alphaproteobacteria bacterium]|nr:NAD(P)-dependent alcohol dehydrogenase [Alphaproteobacteria bacterium]